MADGTAKPAKPVIFISYSKLDEPEQPVPGEVKWRTYVQSHLQPAVKNGIFDLWVDRDIEAGVDWHAEIDQKLNTCDICMLLVSRHALSTDFILDVEVKRMLERHASENLPIFPLVLTPFADETVPWLMAMNLRPYKGKPLSTFALPERDAEMAAIVNEIAKLAKKIVEDRGKIIILRGGLLIPATPPRQLIRADTLLVFDDTRPEGVKINIGRLPETPYENLVGRDKELKRLDDAWLSQNTNIFSLIAEGGAGKSALVNEWLIRLQDNSYNGAHVVLGWSFYSQGSKERATSAEEFLNWALDALGITVTTTSASAKGEAIAEAMAKRRVLLALDGVEPLQHGLDSQQGELKDAGLRALLRRFASTPPAKEHGLVVLTSRLPVKDIARWSDTTAPVVDVEKLSDEAGAALLRDNGVWGTDNELKAAAHDFDGHPLALGLLASFLKETQTGDVRRRDHIRAFFADPENPRHDHAKRVMESYEKEWLAGQPALFAIMHIVGLFDRPASGDCLNALRAKPAIDGLTDQIVGIDDDTWKRAVARLREVRLLASLDPAAPDALDAHPLVREWFGERLKATNETAWKAAHGRLFEHLRDTTKEGDAPTLEDLAPLYQAIAHGCRAARHQEALDDIYVDRLCRRTARGLEFYSRVKLGAIGSDLAGISWFFDKPYAIPVATLNPTDRSWVLGEAALRLRAQGRFAEALPAYRAALQMAEDAQHWDNAASRASNLSEVELLAGEVATAGVTAEQSIALADRGREEFHMIVSRGILGDVLRAAGRNDAAAQAFADAERRQKKLQPYYPLLYSLGGYLYCDMLLAEGDYPTARGRATQTMKWTRQHGSLLLSIALDTLTVGRAHLGLALATARTHEMSAAMRDDVRIARAHFDEAVDGLRAAGTSDYLPRGLLARATFRRSVGDWDGAMRDFEEVEEVAEPGPMKLHLCDLALQRARLAFAQIETFAPLNGTLEKDNPPKPAVPGGDQIASPKSEAEKQLKIAADYIEKCGYHRRDEELVELQAVLRGEKKFADLPPRV
jgi:tetratricopeptide (TPR) repeat protein